jgi:hypothetical protein
MLNGITYIVLPSMHPGNRSATALSASSRLIQFPSIPLAEPLGTLTASLRFVVHMNVRLSTLATSLGELLAKKQFLYFGSGTMVRFSNRSSMSIEFSASDPSQTYTFDGLHSRTLSSTKSFSFWGSNDTTLNFLTGCDPEAHCKCTFGWQCETSSPILSKSGIFIFYNNVRYKI